MTIEEAIKELRTPTILTSGTQFDEDMLQLAEWLEELKTLRVELERNSKELEVYKKALELACDDIRCANPSVRSCDRCQLTEGLSSNCFSVDVKRDYYLQKAREEKC